MANIIDRTYFFGPLHIPQLDQPAVQKIVDDYIRRYEREYLETVLTPGAYVAFMQGLEMGQLEYVFLRDGGAYTSQDGTPAFFKGLRIVEIPANDPAPALYRSPIANYVWYKYTEATRVRMTSAGPKTLKAENAVEASPVSALVTAWNEMVEWNSGLWLYLRSNAATYAIPDPRRGNRLLSKISGFWQ